MRALVNISPSPLALYLPIYVYIYIYILHTYIYPRASECAQSGARGAVLQRTTNPPREYRASRESPGRRRVVSARSELRGCASSKRLSLFIYILNIVRPPRFSKYMSFHCICTLYRFVANTVVRAKSVSFADSRGSSLSRTRAV